VRGLQPTGAARQLALPIVDRRDSVDRMWESFSPAAQERILRLLAQAIARVLSQQEASR
jgi:Tfp pilus assembly pilus retraction ATPase PilT